MMTFVQLFLTCEDRAEAQTIADALLEQKLIACAKILGSIESSFWWKSAIEKSSEVPLMMESHESRCTKIEEAIKPLHSYDTFVLTAVPMVYISAKARAWLQDSLELL